MFITFFSYVKQYTSIMYSVHSTWYGCIIAWNKYLTDSESCQTHLNTHNSFFYLLIIQYYIIGHTIKYRNFTSQMQVHNCTFAQIGKFIK